MPEIECPADADEDQQQEPKEEHPNDAHGAERRRRTLKLENLVTRHLEGHEGDKGAGECSHNPPSANDQRHDNEYGQGDPIRNQPGELLDPR